MHGGGGISGNGIYNNSKRDSYMPCEAMALSPKFFCFEIKIKADSYMPCEAMAHSTK
jgi:hypothetical protein